MPFLAIYNIARKQTNSKWILFAKFALWVGLDLPHMSKFQIRFVRTLANPHFFEMCIGDNIFQKHIQV